MASDSGATALALTQQEGSGLALTLQGGLQEENLFEIIFKQELSNFSHIIA
jgi:hypothetical protein